MKNVETIQIQEETQRAIYYLVEREDEKWFFRSKKLPSSVRDSKKPVDRQAARYQASKSMYSGYHLRINKILCMKYNCLFKKAYLTLKS